MHHESLTEMLKGCLLFHGAEDETIALVAASLKEVSFKKSDPVILEGQISDHVYFIASGSIEIQKYRPDIQMIDRLVVLKAGDYFSEFSVLNRQNKSASAFALEDSVIFLMDGPAFLNVIQRSPAVARRLVMTLAELNSNSASRDSLEYFDASALELHPEISKLMPNMIWRKFGVIPVNYRAGVLLVAAKDPHREDFFQYCKLTWPHAHVNVVLIGQTDFDQTFKKLSKLYEKGTRSKFETAKPPPEHSVNESLKQSVYFDNAEDAGLEAIAALFEPVAYETGVEIYKPGEASEYFYMVQSGQIELNVPMKHGAGWTRLRSRKPSEGFGEISLILDHPHSHSARASVPSKILRMPKAVFISLLESSDFCLNLSKVLALRLQHLSDTPAHRFFDETKPLQLKELGKLIPRQTMQLQQIIPLRAEGKEITLGILNPGNEAIYSIAHRYLRGFRIQAEVITLEKFNLFLNQTDTTLAKLPNDGHHAPAAPAAAIATAGKDDNTVLELNRLLIDGFEARASDLHLEPTGTGYTVRYRVDGVLTEIANAIPQSMGETLINRIKVLGHLDISNHFTPQDGQLKINEDNQDYMARVATTPTKQGEGAVLRLIRSRSSSVPLTMLTPDPRTIKAIRAISKLKQGLFLVTGPTGSGKTTTLYSLLAELNRVDVKIISIEDPVELEIAGITQIEINEKMGLTFERALRSTLRQDPDVMMLGEIRDAESARAVFEAALQGHLVISTLHTNNSFAVKGRLRELGVPVGTIAAGLVGSMAQRLVRAVCKKCRVQRPMSKSEREMIQARLGLGNDMQSHVWTAKGCPMCNHSGYQGRLPVIEIWQKNRALEDLLANDVTTDTLLKEAKNDGFMSLYDSGLAMALNGLTTLEEVDRCMAGGL